MTAHTTSPPARTTPTIFLEANKILNRTKLELDLCQKLINDQFQHQQVLFACKGALNNSPSFIDSHEYSC